MTLSSISTADPVPPSLPSLSGWLNELKWQIPPYPSIPLWPPPTPHISLLHSPYCPLRISAFSSGGSLELILLKIRFIDSPSLFKFWQKKPHLWLLEYYSQCFTASLRVLKKAPTTKMSRTFLIINRCFYLFLPWTACSFHDSICTIYSPVSRGRGVSTMCTTATEK